MFKEKAQIDLSVPVKGWKSEAEQLNENLLEQGPESFPTYLQAANITPLRLRSDNYRLLAVGCLLADWNYTH